MIFVKINDNGTINAFESTVSDSIKYETVKFQFPQKWQKYSKTAVFRNKDSILNIVLDSSNDLCVSEEECYIPYEVLKAPYFTVSVFGISEDSRVTTEETEIKVIPSGYGEGDEPSNPTPSEYEQLVNLANETKQIAQSVRNDADKGLFNGQEGPQGEKGNSGVYVGSGEMPEDCNVQIDPNGDVFAFNPATTPEQEGAKLGEELVSANGWTTDGWTGDFTNGFTHTSGNTNSLIFTMSENTKGKLYQISFNTSQALTTTNLFVMVGGSELFNLYGQADPVSIGVRAIENGNLEFIPASNFTGTLTDISIKEIIGESDDNFIIKDSRGNEAFAIHTTKASTSDSRNGENNLFIGVRSGKQNTSGYGNVGVGTGTLKNNTSGFWNVGLGYRALESNTAGSRNLAMGYVALLKNEVGQRNVALGTHALREHRKGDFNIAIGADAQLEGTEGEGNIALGVGTLYKNSGGNYNTAIGYGAIGGGELGSRGDNNIGIGKFAMPSVTGNNNICIGYQAGYGITTGKNNVVIGSDSGRNGTQNVVVGSVCGQYLNQWAAGNVLIGFSVGGAMSGGSYNILIGRNIAGESGSEYTRNLNIGGLLKGKIEGDDDPHLDINGGLQLAQIPTTDPGIAGRVWNDNGTLKVSAGQ